MWPTVTPKKANPNSVRNEQVNAMRLTAFLIAHRKIEEQEATIAESATSLN
jgi:hypothetical protein